MQRVLQYSDNLLKNFDWVMPHTYNQLNCMRQFSKGIPNPLQIELSVSEKENDSLYFRWIPKLDKISFKDRFKADSSKCTGTTGQLSSFLIKILSFTGSLS